MASTLMGEIVTAVVDLPPERVEFPGGSVQITGLQLQMKNTKHNTKSALASPNLVNIDVDQIQLGVKGKITGTMNDNHFDGELSMTTMNLKVALSLAIRNNGNGIPNMHLAACKISQPVPSLFDIVAAKLTAGNKQVLEKSLTAGSNQIFEALICSRIEFVLENRINDRFSLIPNKLAMNTLAEQAIIDEVISKMALRRRQVRSNTQIRLTRAVGARFNLTRASNLLLDYGVVGNPSVVGNFLEINSVSEISLNGRGGTPFGAQPLILPSDLKEDAMMQLIVSDFVPNSLLYHGHNTGIFNTRIDSKTPHFASMMKSSCSISDGVFFCLGTLFRNLSVTFPGRELIMIFKTLKAPVMKFHPLSKGGIQFHIVGEFIENDKNRLTL
uniref:BPI2 domain-containing protein n=1 Tax=Rhabditophanes sp. KR3021 TaxID=114890 RepID=A0AC35TS72_9BILA